MAQALRNNIDFATHMQDTMAGIVRHYGKVIRIIGRQDIVVSQTRNNNGIPAWTDLNNNVYLNVAVLESKIAPALVDPDPAALRNVLATINGMMHHELCHLLYSPSLSSKLVRWLKQNTCYWMGWNLLEDMRIESVYVSRFRVFSMYFTKMVAEWVIDNQVNPSSYLYLSGRRYLPSALLDSARNEFVAQFGSAVADKVDVLSAEFKTFAMRSLSDDDLDRVKEIVIEFTTIMRECDNQSHRGLPRPTSDHFTKHVGSSGASNPPEAKRDEKQAVEEMGEESVDEMLADEDESDDDGDDGAYAESDDADDTEEDDESDTDAIGGEGDDDADGEADTATEGDGAGGDEGGKDGPGSGEDAKSGSGRGESQSDGQADPNGDQHGDGEGIGGDASNGLRDVASQVLEDLSTTEQFIKASSEVKEAVLTGGETGHASDRLPLVDTAYANNLPEGQYLNEARQVVSGVERYIMRLRNELEPIHEKGYKTGRLNMRSAVRRQMSTDPAIDIFNRFVPGREDDASLDIAVAIDMSSSMQSNGNMQASAVAWSVKHAMDKLMLPCLVLRFASSSDVVWDYDERCTPQPVDLFSGGNTNPSGALIAADAFFRRPGANKAQALIVMTDGQWGIGDSLVQKMNEQGVFTALFGLAGAVRTHGTHGCQYARDVSGPLDILPIIEALVQSLVRSAVDSAE